MTIEIDQTSEPMSSKRWKWQIWLKGSSEELDAVESVEYQLHSTFRDPIRTVEDRETKFMLSASAWGEFNIHATIHLRDGGTHKLEHWLRLGELAPAKGVALTSIATQGESPAVFLSAGSGDSVLAREMRQALLGQGLQVMSQEDIPPGAGWESELESMMDKADFGIVVVSEDTSPWVQKDAERMLSLRIPVIPLILDVNEPPASMRDFEFVRVNPNDDLDERAGQIVELAKALGSN